MRISKSLRAFGILALITPLVSHSEHQPPMQFGEKQFPERMAPLQGLPTQIFELDLSEMQQDKIFALIHPQIPQIWEREKQRHQLINELRKLSDAEIFDEAKAKQSSEKLAELEKDAVFNRAKIDSQIFAILTPEQRKQLLKHKPHLQDDFHKNVSQSHM
jgi:Spy/CpxP family protein refolding chaperone